MLNDIVVTKTRHTVLSIDDSPDKLELLSLILKAAGYHVLTAASGREGLKIATQELPDLIVSDVSMPSMDGIELCRLIRADERLARVPIILVTALYKDTETMARGLAAGADEYIEAPFDPSRLVARAARLIERKRTEEPLSTLASIVENSEDAIIGKRLDGTITNWNYGAERIYGFEAAEVLGQSIYASIIPEDKREETEGILNAISRGIRVNRFQTQRLRKDGKLIDVSLSISPIKDGRGRLTGASAIARDITEWIRAEDERKRLINELQDALAEVKTLRGIVPICMHCKKIRNEAGAWTQLESYIREHTHAEFSHGICGACAQSMYPGIHERTSAGNG
jgi:PAS domain S-box-containing protein